MIQTITVSSRAESRVEVAVTAVVQDQETTPANLVYEWTPTGGTVTGTGASVRWLMPGVTTPTALDLNLTVIERYTVAVPGGADEARENRVSGKATVHVNDSSREVTDLATTFIDDFLHSERTPEFCVRNFSDTCPGKQEELRDIRDNRANFVNNPAASSMGPGIDHVLRQRQHAPRASRRRRRRASPNCSRRAASRRPPRPPAPRGSRSAPAS